MQRFARRKPNYFRLNALKSKRIMQEPMAVENLLRWLWMVMRVKTKKIPWLVLASYFWCNMQEQS